MRLGDVLIPSDTLAFLDALLARSATYRNTACLTLTAIHPDGKHRTPSRHIPLTQPDQLHEALQRLLQANRLGWGAFVAVGLRQRGLTRYRRGSEHDLMALPAVFVDLDDTTSASLTHLRDLRPAPSCITFTGGGFHAYWWLDEPLTDMGLARSVLRGLQHAAKSDALSPVQSLRLVGTRNTKPQRENALCRIVELHDTYHSIEAFAPLLPRPTVYLPAVISSRKFQRSRSNPVNPTALQAVTDRLRLMGYVQQGDWLSGACLYPARHQHADRHPSFGFNTRTGYGNCYVCGSMLLKDICLTLGI